MSDEKVRVSWLVDSLPSVSAGGNTSDFVDSLLGPGDDCGVVRTTGPVDVVIGTDYVRGVKFSLFESGHLTLRDIGRFLVTANTSDLAAMGADPVAFLAVVRYAPDMTDEDFQEVMLGIDEACCHYDLRLLGGDSGSAERLILSGTAVGLCPAGKALRRDAAQPGDVVCVTGPLGGAGAAVALLQAGLDAQVDSADWLALVRRWKEPVAQPEVGLALRAARVRVAAQDISDGLRATVRELSEASRVAVVLDLDAIPLGEGVSSAARHLKVGAANLAISGSTDFSICFACHPDDMPRVREEFRRIGAAYWPVGQCEVGERVWVRSSDGALQEAPGAEWRHQKGEIGVLLSELRTQVK